MGHFLVRSGPGSASPRLLTSAHPFVLSGASDAKEAPGQVSLDLDQEVGRLSPSAWFPGHGPAGRGSSMD